MTVENETKKKMEHEKDIGFGLRLGRIMNSDWGLRL